MRIWDFGKYANEHGLHVHVQDFPKQAQIWVSEIFEVLIFAIRESVTHGRKAPVATTSFKTGEWACFQGWAYF